MTGTTRGEPADARSRTTRAAAIRRAVWATILATGCGATAPRAEREAEPTPLPTVDRDGDSIADEDDGCPCEAEDADGREDEDGCPDVDDDADRILDACDRCPSEAETWNGHQDDDGCPDDSLVVVSDMRIVIVERFYFAAESSHLERVADPLLRALAATIEANPQVRIVRLIGHADAGERHPERIAAARADAVFEALVALGVDPARLAVESRGATEPLDASGTEEGRALNRRVGRAGARRARHARSAARARGTARRSGLPERCATRRGPTVLRSASLLAIGLALLAGACGSAPPPAREPDPEAAAEPVDRDGDGLTDPDDVCPCAAEDVDDFEDGDGCPDVDDDGDMILDACDRCPQYAETWDGVVDEDGCPDEAPALLRVGMIRILETIHFERGSSTLSDESLQIVGVIAQILRENPQLTLVRIIGHADDGERHPETLAASRADAVFEALVARGVARERLAVESRGTTEPLDERDTATARALNRRVSFDIAEPSPPPPAPLVPATPTEPAPPHGIPSEPICPGGSLPEASPPC